MFIRVNAGNSGVNRSTRIWCQLHEALLTVPLVGFLVTTNWVEFWRIHFVRALRFIFVGGAGANSVGASATLGASPTEY